MQYITDIISTMVVFGAFTIVIVAVLNFILKMRIINSGYKDEAWVKSLTSSGEYKYSSLKWAILLFFGGLGLVALYFIPLSEPFESPLAYGILAISLSAGFIVYYLIAGRHKQES